MSDTVTNAVVTADAPPALKSNDTRAVTAAPPATEAKPEPVAKAPTPTPDAPAPEGDEGGHDDTDAPTAEAPRDKPKQRLPRWMQERLERERQVTRERTRAEVLAEVQRSNPAPQQAAPQADPTAERERTLEDFDFDPNRYTEYLVDRKLAKKEREAQAAVAQRETAEKLETFKSRVDTFEARAGAGAWEDIATSPLNTDPGFAPLVDAFMGEACDLDIAHHLAQNLDEARRLMGLSPIARARELTKLADRFEHPKPAAPEAREEPKPKTVTQAPPPPSKLGSGKPSVDINNPQMSTADRIAAWKKSRQA
jgi:hypothetical protein